MLILEAEFDTMTFNALTYGSAHHLRRTGLPTLPSPKLPPHARSDKSLAAGTPCLPSLQLCRSTSAGAAREKKKVAHDFQLWHVKSIVPHIIINTPG